MKLIVAENCGFCFGVKRAVEMAENAAKKGAVYTVGQLIHNPDEVARLENKGIIPVDSPNDAPKGAQVLIRSHGVPPEVIDAAAERQQIVIDATCPFVARIHAIAEEYSNNGYIVVIAGEAAHPEVVGIQSRCRRSVVIKRPDDIAGISEQECMCLVAQTTMSAERYGEIMDEAAKRPAETTKIFNTICNTTRERQEEAARLARECTQMIVIGGRNSSNTEKLSAVCKKACVRVQTIANQSELSLEKMKSDDIIGLVAGASTPDWIIREVIYRMSEQEKTVAENTESEIMEVETVAAAAEPDAVQPTEEVKAEECKCECKVEEPAEDKSSDNGQESFAEAFEKTMRRIHNGQILTGNVVQIVDGEVCVNIGYKSDGFIPKSEFSLDPDVNPAETVKVGDEIEVEVLKVNDGEGNVLLSRKNVESKKMWDVLMQDEDVQSKTFEGVGKEVVKGGLIATIDGVRAFVPASQLSNKYVENIGEFVGKPISLKVIEVDKARKRIVASHKAVLAEEAEAAKREKWSTLVVGEKMKGVVRRLTDFGAFVDIGGIDGLVHVTDVAWGRVKHPSDVLSVGQEIEVLVRDVDVEKQRVSLGYKQLQPKPWTMAGEKYPVGMIVEGKVVRIVPFGAFVALEPTIDGLIHISQVGVKRIVKVEDEINVGDIVRCKVLDVNPEAKRISLSRKEALIEENPEIAAEIEREREERERIQQERAEQRNQQQEQRRQQPGRTAEQQQQQPRRERTDRPDRGERRPRREDADYQLPPVESSSTSMADLLAGFKIEE